MLAGVERGDRGPGVLVPHRHDRNRIDFGIVSRDKLHSPDTTYWPEFDGGRAGALKEEFAYFATCALEGKTPAIGRPEDAAAALEATLAAEESARTGNVIRIGGM